MERRLPSVTVIICNHNYGHFVEGAIKSALSQTYPVLQVCVIDDGSTDNSWDVIERSLFSDNYKENYNSNSDITTRVAIDEKGLRRFLAIQLPKPTGPSNARNVGIEATWDSTDIYAILDADDENYSQKISKCVEVMSVLGPAVGVVYADYDILNTNTGNIIREYKEPYDKFRLNQECIVHSGSVITKQALEHAREETGFYDRTMRTCEDYDLWMRISEKFMIYHIPEALSLVRVTPYNSTSSVRNEIWQRNWRRVVEKTHARQQNVKI